VASHAPARHWVPLMLLQAPPDWKPYNVDISLRSVYIFRHKILLVVHADIQTTEKWCTAIA
jgi:hypothetical protein